MFRGDKFRLEPVGQGVGTVVANTSDLIEADTFVARICIDDDAFANVEG